MTDLSALTPDERLDFEERAAIREFSGKQGRDAAERGALEDVLRQRGPVTVTHCKRDASAVYIGRAMPGFAASRWGNPWTLKEHGLRALDLYRTWFLAEVAKDAEFRAATLALAGKALGCWCATADGTVADDGTGACHGHIIAEWVNRQPKK